MHISVVAPKVVFSLFVIRLGYCSQIPDVKRCVYVKLLDCIVYMPCASERLNRAVGPLAWISFPM